MKAKAIVVTGANGYIGHHVTKKLLDLGNEVIAVDVHRGQIDPRAQFIEKSIFDCDNNLFEILGKPEACIHLAWRNGFQHNSDTHIQDLPKHCWFINHLFQNGLDNLTIMGTMHEIGYWEGIVDENTPANPLSMYGIAKNTLRQVAKLLASKYEKKLKWLRGFYVLGDDLGNNSIFTKILEQEAKGVKNFPFGSGENKYDFLDINALADQIIAASLQTDFTGEINCCSGKPVALGEKVEQFIKENHLKIKLEYGAFPSRPYDSPQIWGDNRIITEIMNKTDLKY